MDTEGRAPAGISWEALLSPDATPRPWLPTPANVNALPPGLREYVYELETNADPAHRASQVAIQADAIEALQARVVRLSGALDIETLRGYHDTSFLDPPSYHTPAEDSLWECARCVERFITRARAALSAEPPPGPPPARDTGETGRA